MPRLPGPHSPDRYSRFFGDACRYGTQKLHRFDMQQRAIAVCRPQALPRRVAGNSPLNLHAGAAHDCDLYGHSRRRLARSNDSQRYFGPCFVAGSGFQQMGNAHGIVRERAWPSARPVWPSSRHASLRATFPACASALSSGSCLCSFAISCRVEGSCVGGTRADGVECAVK
jgi:hypothetical protein